MTASKPRVSVCMVTASPAHPMVHRSESIYDLLRLSIANQTYDGPIEVIVADTEIDRMPGEFSAFWGSVERVVLTRQVLHDRIAISGARNTAAAYARGELLVFVDDCIEILPSFLEAATELYARGKIPTRVLFTTDTPLPTGKIPTCALLRMGAFAAVDPVWQNHGSPTDLTEWDLSGQAGGVFVIPRDVFLYLNGFDENFDGTWGCEDQEFCARLDRAKFSRVGRADLAVLCWAHSRTPPRGMIRRCRELYAQWAYRSSRLDANRRLPDEVLDELRGAPACVPTCPLCQAPDRAEQIETYRTIPAEFDLRALQDAYSARPSGVYLDPWR